ncbi:PREDICTED: GATA-type zinc finger protein 1 [Elephantulus edwardii]|uniref:GATA-type zinc finger protein 1 n=1 Tax=Elephantulus edwardii TaxID=28737 RepID=UPI0003F0D966|nr:PREDICTED: GATA-type zinc finger protein 1 [Elephantulus edwardii]
MGGQQVRGAAGCVRPGVLGGTHRRKTHVAQVIEDAAGTSGDAAGDVGVNPGAAQRGHSRNPAPRSRWGASENHWGRPRRTQDRTRAAQGAMEARPSPHFSMLLLRELLAPPGLETDRPPTGCGCRPSSRGTLPVPEHLAGFLGGSTSPVHQASVAALCFLQAGRSRWDPMALGSLARDAKDMPVPVSQRCLALEQPRTSPAPSAQPQRRPRKQPNPLRGTEKVDPGFEGVTLKFQIKPDSSLQIIPSYSLSCSSRAPGPPAGPAKGPEADQGGGDVLGPRRCASCRTQRTPLWRDAEDGTPLCNACGIRYKKYGTRCSTCWLVPRKNVQPKRLCGRCGVSLGAYHGPAQQGDPGCKTLASGSRAPQGKEEAEGPVPGGHGPPPQSVLQMPWTVPPPRKLSQHQ